MATVAVLSGWLPADALAVAPDFSRSGTPWRVRHRAAVVVGTCGDDCRSFVDHLTASGTPALLVHGGVGEALRQVLSRGF